jgi:hypothetical protein
VFNYSKPAFKKILITTLWRSWLYPFSQCFCSLLQFFVSPLFRESFKIYCRRPSIYNILYYIHLFIITPLRHTCYYRKKERAVISHAYADQTNWKIYVFLLYDHRAMPQRILCIFIFFLFGADSLWRVASKCNVYV